MERRAEFSACRRYRYRLWRNWSGLFPTGRGYAMFIGLNPSTADETQDDPTIRRCIAFSRSWGYDGLCMTNLFAFRATDSAEMLKASDPVGRDNNAALIDCASSAGIVIAAWGTLGGHLGRDQVVKSLLPQLHYLRITRDGHPAHPLYLPADLTPCLWF